MSAQLGRGAVVMLAALAAPQLRADTLDVLVVGSAAADLWTTQRALGAGRGLREGNPLMGTPEARIGVKALASTVAIVTGHYLDRRGHHRFSKIFRLAFVVIWSGAAIQNEIRMRRGR